MKTYEIGPKDTVVFFIHGLRGHGLSHEKALQHIAKHSGVRIVSIELPGHGQDSFKEKCMVPNYLSIVADIAEEIEQKLCEDEHIVLMGYSFGAALAILTAKQLQKQRQFRHRISGVIGVSTAFHVEHNVAPWKLRISKYLAAISRFTHIHISYMSHLFSMGEMAIESVSADPTVQQHIRDDELIYKGRIPLFTSAQVYLSSQAAGKALQKQTEWKTLLIHSEDDGIAKPYAHTLPSSAKMTLFKHLRHNCIDGRTREAAQARMAITKFITSVI